MRRVLAISGGARPAGSTRALGVLYRFATDHFVGDGNKVIGERDEMFAAQPQPQLTARFGVDHIDQHKICAGCIGHGAHGDFTFGREFDPVHARRDGAGAGRESSAQGGGA